MSLTDFVPEPRRVEAGGKSVDVLPLKVRQIPPFARAIAPAMDALARGDLLAALGAHGEALIEAVAVATGETAEWLGGLDADDFLALATAVLEVNADFFGRRVAPMLAPAMDRLTSAMTGQTPSPSSPPPASSPATPST